MERDLKISQDLLASTLEKAAREKEQFERQMAKMTAKVTELKGELKRVEETLTSKISELTVSLTKATTENAHLRSEVARLQKEVEDTLRAWKENVAQVRKECAEEIERRGKEIYAAFALERETHVRRLKIQNYEIAKRDLYCVGAQDLNPLPLPEYVEMENEKGEPMTLPEAFCLKCKSQAVFEVRREKAVLDAISPSGRKSNASSPLKSPSKTALKLPAAYSPGRTGSRSGQRSQWSSPKRKHGAT